MLCAIVGVSFLLLASQGQATCENYNNCTACTGEANPADCGWEADFQQCLTGSSSGPNSGSSASWVWINSGCRSQDPCAVHTSCSGCIAAGSCGWDTYFCRTGSSSGPQYGTAALWYWTSCTTPSGTPAPITTTPGISCSSYTGCYACNAVSNCGWEDDLQQCAAGDSTGPTNGGYSGAWVWGQSGCPSQDPCNVNTNCGSCVDSTSPGDCGWDEGFCRTGTSSGPTYGTAGSWYWTTNSCSTTPAPTTGCSSYTGCYACNVASNCGWEDDSQQCATGDSTGPTNGYSGAWVWGQSGCPSQDPCNVNTNCGSCVDSSSGNCGWDIGFCRTGSSNGPTYGTAASWYWATNSCPSTPSPSSSSSIVVEECTAEDCASGCQTKNLVAGCTSGIDGSGTSQLLFCVGSNLHQQLYNATESCSGTPADEFEYPAGLCVLVVGLMFESWWAVLRPLTLGLCGT